ncbi:MAG: 1-deoxy-D-xylulose-5-phosphate synthase [Bacteroidales bacterium]|jgi:1-deoxy-D-xylulose-5-phosphate synthase|nr:1-deoxy-D-xylulose-5-phosphate synthase [Bacteroidales bacterium]
MRYLDTIKTPEDLRKLPLDKLPQLCDELRQFIIEQTAKHPGHLGSSLGVVELTVALHYVFNTPDDRLVWDVGHQAYAHKILTGRKDEFATNRCYGGISGFPRREESEYDAFGTGHSSTSISAVLGMAMAAKMEGNDKRNHIAVIGDGAIGGGMAFEAMNQASYRDVNMLLILNDNKISIDQSTGAMSKYLLSITTSPAYNRFKNRMWNLFTFKTNKSNKITNFFSKLGNGMKGYLLGGSNLFQGLGYRYFGPADGHDVVSLVKTLRGLKKLPGLKLFHVLTVKGKGLEMAEQHQTAYHAPGKFNPDTGQIIQPDTEGMPPKYQDVFGHTILEIAREDEKVVGITPAMATGCSLTIMDEVLPERVFDVGIAEQHAVTFAAGLAAEGYIPFCNIYSSFLQRGYDQVIHDVALQKLPVIFCIDRAGLVGEDGATHQGAYDLAFLRAVPNLIIASPLNEHELRNMMMTAYHNAQQGGLPFVVRYPRGRGVLVDWRNEPQDLPIGKGRVLREGERVLVLSLGPLGNNVAKALDSLQAENIRPGHVDVRFLKPLDEELLRSLAAQYPVWLTVEDGTEKGGLFSAVAEFLEDNGLQNQLHHIAIPDRFIAQGDIPNIYREVGFDVESVMGKIRGIYD